MKAGKILLGLILVGLIGLGVKIALTPKDFSYAGTLEATKVDLSAQLASTINTVSVREGDAVTALQELVTLACEDVKVASKLANQNYERHNRLFKAGTVSQDIIDQVKNKKDDIDLRLKWCLVTSPINGRVLSRYREPGEWVNPGTKLLTLANIKDIWTYIYVPQQEVSKLHIGQKIIGIVPEIPDQQFEGEIIKINSEAEFTPKNVQTESERTRLVFGIKISFLGANNDEILKPGMTIEVKL